MLNMLECIRLCAWAPWHLGTVTVTRLRVT